MPNTLSRTHSVDAAFTISEVRDFLMAAALHQVERVRNFIEGARIPVDATFDGKPTAICYVVLKPHPELVHYLISQGARANQVDALGMTPLHYAALGGCEYCISLLLSRGAYLNHADVCGKTPLALTLDKPHLNSCRELLAHHGGSVIAGELPRERMH